jgi:hypothetical protein
MDDKAALIVRRVAMAAVEEWHAYCVPRMDSESREELLDELADVAPPMPLGDGVAADRPDTRFQTRLRRAPERGPEPFVVHELVSTSPRRVLDVLRLGVVQAHQGRVDLARVCGPADHVDRDVAQGQVDGSDARPGCVVDVDEGVARVLAPGHLGLLASIDRPECLQHHPAVGVLRRVRSVDAPEAKSEVAEPASCGERGQEGLTSELRRGIHARIPADRSILLAHRRVGRLRERPVQLLRRAVHERPDAEIRRARQEVEGGGHIDPEAFPRVSIRRLQAHGGEVCDGIHRPDRFLQSVSVPQVHRHELDPGQRCQGPRPG